jgi:hypothetical protein
MEGIPAMPALLSTLIPNARPIFVPRLLGQRPELAALVAETISTWSFAEHALGRSVAAMSPGTSAVEMEGYIADWRLPARMKIVRRVAKAKLAEPYLATFLKVLDVIRKLATQRHAFAHGIWGTVEALPNALLLVDPKHMFRHWGAANDWLAAFIESGPGSVNRFGSLDNQHVEVWPDTELREEVDRMNKLYELALKLESIASEDPFDASSAKRNHIHGLLLTDPLVGS